MSDGASDVPTIRVLIDDALAGDVRAVDALRPVPHEIVLAAANEGSLTVPRAAVTRVLAELASAQVADHDVQRWASFVQEGMIVPQVGPITPIHFEYEPAYESAIADAVGRLAELGEAIDGEISAAERQRLMERLA